MFRDKLASITSVSATSAVHAAGCQPVSSSSDRHHRPRPQLVCAQRADQTRRRGAFYFERRGSDRRPGCSDLAFFIRLARNYSCPRSPQIEFGRSKANLVSIASAVSPVNLIVICSAALFPQQNNMADEQAFVSWNFSHELSNLGNDRRFSRVQEMAP